METSCCERHCGTGVHAGGRYLPCWARAGGSQANRLQARPSHLSLRPQLVQNTHLYRAASQNRATRRVVPRRPENRQCLSDRSTARPSPSALDLP
ncbi:hypothetical protein SKAU_G00185140 [Synaphobranchus kaupii]|uniref:Uncharacterized protein n=1 Tax=Synaphobranchus kaupii TaxID=118154 RepID=A0A9Q1IWW1_SYNKA|nr:hypothetical protein SKAU_G00185140 [Synaphobranchus kaupii]